MRWQKSTVESSIWFVDITFLPPNFVDQLLKMKATILDLSSRTQIVRWDKTGAGRFKQCLFVCLGGEDQVLFHSSDSQLHSENHSYTVGSLGNLNKILILSPRGWVHKAL